MNRQQLDEFTAAVKHHFGDDNTAMNAASFGAMWQEQQNAAEIARLEAERAELLEFIENLGSPKRGSVEEGWDYFEASQIARGLAKKYDRK